MSVTDDEYRAMHQQHARERYGTPTGEKKNEMLRLLTENEQLRVLAKGYRDMYTAVSAWQGDYHEVDATIKRLDEQAKALGIEVNA